MTVDLQHFNKNYDTIYIYSYILNKVMQFPAFLTEISDTRNSMWSTNEIYGRINPIYTYKNTVRKISIAFDVPCSSVDDSIKFNSLLRIDMKNSMYSNYKSREEEPSRFSIATPPFHRIRYCNLIKSNRSYTQTDSSGNLIQDGIFGWLDGYNFSPKIEDGFFINRKNYFAKMFSVNLTLNVIHEHLLGTKESSYYDEIVSRSENNFILQEKQQNEMGEEEMPDTPLMAGDVLIPEGTV